MKFFGIIGKPIKHSASKLWFENYFLENKIDARFDLLTPSENELANLKEYFRNNSFSGLLVTLPYKKVVLPNCDLLDVAAKEIGAVNIIALKNEKLCGYNIDYSAFESEILKLRPAQDYHFAIILGNGGAAAAVEYALKKNNIKYMKVSRRNEPDCVLYENLQDSDLQKANLIINATPLGMGNLRNDFPPINCNSISRNTVAFDLIYNPAETLFLAKCKQKNCIVINGFGMVNAVYEKASKIFEL